MSEHSFLRGTINWNRPIHLVDMHTWRPICGHACLEGDIQIVHGFGKGPWCERCRRKLPKAKPTL